MSYIFSQKWHRTTLESLSGLGQTATYFGPDQPWSAATAGKWISEKTQECSADKKLVIGYNTPPKQMIDGHYIPDTACVPTGRVKEATKPGTMRVMEWCCPNRNLIPAKDLSRPMTEAELQQNATTCDSKPLTLPDGQVFSTAPDYWAHKTAHVPTAWCVQSGVTDGDYNLLCCREGRIKTKDTKYVAGGTTTVSASAPAPTAAQIQQIAEQEAEYGEQVAQTLESSQEQYGFFQRYGLIFALGAGAIGIGVIAALVKRSRSKKQEEK